MLSEGSETGVTPLGEAFRNREKAKLINTGEFGVIYEIAQQFLAGLLGNLKPEMVAPPSGNGNAMRRFTILCHEHADSVHNITFTQPLVIAEIWRKREYEIT